MYELLIRESHLDTFGHMNNATYLAILEEARWELITSRGYGLGEIMKVRQGPVILEVNLKFLKELHLRETVHISTSVLSYKGKIGSLEQKILKSDGSLSAQALFTFGLFDLNSRKLIEPTAKWLKAIDAEALYQPPSKP